MTAPEANGKTAKAVYWAKSGHDDFGMPKVSSGTEIDVRWIFQTIEIVEADQVVNTADARVVVFQDIVLGTIMRLGATATLPSPVTSADNLYEVIRFRKVPDLKGRNYYREVLLKRYKQPLPTIS